MSRNEDARERYIVSDDDALQRLDRFLALKTAELSRSRIQRLIEAGAAQVNDQPVNSRYKVRAGDVVTLRLPEPVSEIPQPEHIPLPILYEDEDILVVNKPVGMVVHPAPGHRQGTLVNALLAHRPGLATSGLDPMRPGIVHRLDRETSGVLVVAINADAYTSLVRQFKSRSVEKRYLAVANGRLAPERARIDAPVGRDPSHRLRMAVVKGGKSAITEYKVRQYLHGATLADVQLLTGRTHQIRVHLAYIGHPVVGDALYGVGSPRDAQYRLLLHAWRLAFDHPRTGQRICFAASLPHEFVDALRDLGTGDVGVLASPECTG